jgi:hypothetical protein
MYDLNNRFIGNYTEKGIVVRGILIKGSSYWMHARRRETYLPGRAYSVAVRTYFYEGNFHPPHSDPAKPNVSSILASRNRETATIPASRRDQYLDLGIGWDRVQGSLRSRSPGTSKLPLAIRLSCPGETRLGAQHAMHPDMFYSKIDALLNNLICNFGVGEDENSIGLFRDGL